MDNACKEWSIDEDHVTLVGGNLCTDYRTYVDDTCTLSEEVRERGRRRQYIPFTTGNPCLGTKLLGFSIGRGSGALEGIL